MPEEPTPAPKPVRVRISSEPNGAHVAIDAKTIGRTPLEVTLAPGRHELWLGKRGYRILRTSFTLSEDDDPWWTTWVLDARSDVPPEPVDAEEPDLPSWWVPGDATQAIHITRFQSQVPVDASPLGFQVGGYRITSLSEETLGALIAIGEVADAPMRERLHEHGLRADRDNWFWFEVAWPEHFLLWPVALGDLMPLPARGAVRFPAWSFARAEAVAARRVLATPPHRRYRIGHARGADVLPLGAYLEVIRDGVVLEQRWMATDEALSDTELLRRPPEGGAYLFEDTTTPLPLEGRMLSLSADE